MENMALTAITGNWQNGTLSFYQVDDAAHSKTWAPSQYKDRPSQV